MKGLEDRIVNESIEVRSVRSLLLSLEERRAALIDLLAGKVPCRWTCVCMSSV